MNFDELFKKRDYVNNNIDKLDKSVIENYNDNFDINFTHNSTAIEGNTLTLMETKMILEDNLTVGIKELREIYEVVNHNKAWNFVKKCVSEHRKLDESIVKELHSILMENIIVGGIYRTVDVMITGAKHTPPSVNVAYQELKAFYDTLENNNYNEFERAVYLPAQFVKIHPFVDGNGRTSRIIMNYHLLANGFLPVSIKKDDRMHYYEVLDDYAVNGNLLPFIEMIYNLENEQLDFYIKAINDSN